jgi:hypothetical protein
MISLIFAIVPWQRPILPWHSALMQTMVGMSVMLTWIDQWIPTRSVVLLIKSQDHGGRCPDSRDNFEAHILLHERR